MNACFPGSFDPISNGHLDIIKRCAKIYDKIYVLISNNINKKYTFTVSERIEMIEKVTCDIPNVFVVQSDDLVVNYCNENNIGVIVRGIRNFSDYENEYTLFQFNHDINSNIETVLMFPTIENQIISSSSIKELVVYNQDISKYVPKELIDTITSKFKVR